MTVVTNVFSSGVISASEMNTNFNDLSTAIDSITTANISASAGIVSGQLADKYSLTPWHFNLLPLSSGADLGSAASYQCPTANTEILAAKAWMRSGKSAAICVVEINVAAVSSASGTYPLLTVYKGTEVLGGTGRTLDVAGYHSIYYTNPIDTPLMSLQSQDIIKFSLDGQGVQPTLRGLSATLWLKEELTL
jgi:hypothetical protein